MDAITTHIDIIASKVNDLMHTENTGKTDENSITPKVTDIAPTVEENAACQINTTDSKKMEEQIKTLQNVCSVLNNEIKKLVNSQLEMIKKYKKLEELAEKFEEEKKEMGRQFISKDIIIAEQEMRLQVSVTIAEKKMRMQVSFTIAKQKMRMRVSVTIAEQKMRLQVSVTIAEHKLQVSVASSFSLYIERGYSLSTCSNKKSAHTHTYTHTHTLTYTHTHTHIHTHTFTHT